MNSIQVPNTLLIRTLRKSDGRITHLEVRLDDGPSHDRALNLIFADVPNAQWHASTRHWTIPIRSARFARAALSSELGSFCCVADDEDTALQFGLPFPDPDFPTPIGWPITSDALRLVELIHLSGGTVKYTSAQESPLIKIRTPSTVLTVAKRALIDARNADLIEHGSKSLSLTAFGRDVLSEPKKHVRHNRRRLQPHRYLTGDADALARQIERDYARRERFRLEPGLLQWSESEREHMLNGERVSVGTHLEMRRGLRWVSVRYELTDHRRGQAVLHTHRGALEDLDGVWLRWPKR